MCVHLALSTALAHSRPSTNIVGLLFLLVLYLQVSYPQIQRANCTC